MTPPPGGLVRPRRVSIPAIAFAWLFAALSIAPPAAAAVRHDDDVRGGGSRPAPLVVIVLENKNFGEIVRDPDAPYLNQEFIPSGTLFTDLHAITKPSLPNYIAMTAGSLLGCRSNECAPGYDAANLFSQLGRKRIPWQVWATGLPKPCWRGEQEGFYVRRHNPAVFYDDIYPYPCRNRVLPFPEQLPDRLLRFTFIVPDLCEDMHDCSVRYGDRWLSRLVPKLLRRDAIVLITFDETSSERTRIATMISGPGVRAGSRDGKRYTLYGVLGGIEEWFGLRRLRAAAETRPLPI